MKNFILISPHFPPTYYRFAAALKNNGFRVLGIGDASYFELSPELRNCLDEYYCCFDMENFENEKRAVQCFRNKYGEIDYLESNNEYIKYTVHKYLSVEGQDTLNTENLITMIEFCINKHEKERHEKVLRQIQEAEAERLRREADAEYEEALAHDRINVFLADYLYFRN